MAQQEFLIQNAGGNCFISVNGVPAAGATLWSQPFNGGPAQQFIPAQYPGSDPGNTGGVVCALYSAGTGSSFNLVLTASGCQRPLTLQPFQEGNLFQLWAYKGAGKSSTFLNLGSNCMLDMNGGQCNGGTIQTWPVNGSSAQSWTTVPVSEASARGLQAADSGAR